MNISRWVSHHAEWAPEKEAVLFEGQSINYGAMERRVARLAGALVEIGIEPGDRVAHLGYNSAELLELLFACARIGAMLVTLNWRLTAAEHQFIFGNCTPKAIVADPEFRDHIDAMGGQTASMQRVLLNGLETGRHLGTWMDYSSLVDAVARPLADGPGTMEMPVQLVYTSGTTGRPKGVLHTHNTGPLRLQRAFENWSRGSAVAGLDNILLMASPVTHVTGQSGMEIPFCSNTRTVFMERWNAVEALDLIDAEHVTASVGATPFLHELLSAAEAGGRRLPSLQVFACGGAEVPPALICKAYEVLEQCRAFRVYGSSEVPLTTLGFAGVGEMEMAASTDGQIADYEVRILDDEGNRLSVGQEGEICVNGPSMFLGYGDPEATAASFDADGFFATGDLGRVTSEGAIVITGRKKDLINRGGEKVSAKEVEDILHRMPAIKEAAVVAMPHARLGETLCAYVIAQPGAGLDLDALLAFVAASGVARQKYPEHLVVVEDFPRTASGKIRKDRLRADIRERQQAKA